nr:anti-sigma factor [Nocardia carnea]
MRDRGAGRAGGWPGKRAQRAAGGPPGICPRPPRGGGGGGAPAPAAAVVVAIGIGFGVLGRQTGDDPGGAVTAQQILEQPDARTSSTPIGTGGTLTVHFSAELGAATVAFDAVPAPPDGSDYQLWLIDATGVPQPAGVLPELPAANAPYITEFSGSGQLAVTIEPDGGSPAPTSTPLGAVTLG